MRSFVLVLALVLAGGVRAADGILTFGVASPEAWRDAWQTYAAQQAGLTNAAHVAASDPHGDRAWAGEQKWSGVTNADYATTAGVVTGVQSNDLAVAKAHTNQTDNPHTTTMQQVVNTTSGPVTNAPFLVQWTSIPAATNSPGTVGFCANGTNYLYICVDADRWKRVSLVGW